MPRDTFVTYSINSGAASHSWMTSILQPANCINSGKTILPMWQGNYAHSSASETRFWSDECIYVCALAWKQFKTAFSWKQFETVLTLPSVDTKKGHEASLNPPLCLVWIGLKVSLGSWPRSILAFQDLCTTSVATTCSRLPKRLWPWVEVNQRGWCVLQWGRRLCAKLLPTVHLMDDGADDS